MSSPLDYLTPTELMIAAIKAGHVFSATRLPATSENVAEWNRLVVQFGHDRQRSA